MRHLAACGKRKFVPWDLRATMMLSWPTCNRWCPDGCRKVACSDLEKYLHRPSTNRPRPLAQLHKLGLSSPEEEYVCQTSKCVKLIDNGAIVVIGGSANQFVAGWLNMLGADLTARLNGQFLFFRRYWTLSCLETWPSSFVALCKPAEPSVRTGKLTASSCEHWSLEGVCPHVAFVAHLGVQGHAAPPRNLADFPISVRRGRRRGQTTKRDIRLHKRQHLDGGNAVNHNSQQ